MDYAFGIGLISSKRTIRSKLSTTHLPLTVNERSPWFLGFLFLMTRFDHELTIQLIDSILLSPNLELVWPRSDANSTEFFDSIQKKIMPTVHKLLNKSKFKLVLQRLHHFNVPVFHLLAHFTYRHYIGFLNYAQFIDYFVLQLILGPKFQVCFILQIEYIHLLYSVSYLMFFNSGYFLCPRIGTFMHGTLQYFFTTFLSTGSQQFFVSRRPHNR